MLKSSSVLNPFNKINAQASYRLFCFPFAGSGAGYFRSWVNCRQAGELDICPIQFPARENRIKEKPIDELSVLLEELISAMNPYLDVPFAFFGHSFGALVAFEATRVLRRNSYPLPVHVFISGRSAPQLPFPNPLLYNLADSELLKGLQNYNGIPEVIFQNSELMELFLPAIRADLKINESYQYKKEEPLDCPITVFGGSEDKYALLEDLKAWEEQTTKQFKLYFFTGGHFYLKSEYPNLLEIMRQDIRSSVFRKDKII